MLDLSPKTPLEPHASELSKAWEALFAREDLGFLKLPEREENWSSCVSHGRTLAQKFKRLVIVGMGGSSLGARCLPTTNAAGRELLFLDNLDSLSMDEHIRNVAGRQDTHWVIISKSGSTLETMSMLKMLSPRFESQGWATVISESKESQLVKWGRENEAHFLEVPKDVGGRFSVLTPVGLLPAAFLGLDIEKMREGARASLSEDRDFVVGFASQVLASWRRGEWVTMFWPYSDRLQQFAFWFQQLWAESLAKKETRDGGTPARVSTPIACLGPRDQHSLLQQVVEGARDKLMIFFRVESSEQGEIGRVLAAEAEATKQALDQDAVSNIVLRMKDLDAQTLGRLFMSMQLVVGVLGEHLNIDAFNQPGVESGKRLAKEILAKAH